ncbi:MAG TPA: MFS transporter, partial [Chloroflexota bacterium]|nr:MFS transporter [Chloroflexota bacterium]
MKLLSNRSLLTLCVAAFATYTGAGMVGAVRVLYVQSHGGSLVVISAMASAFLVANFVFQYPWGWLSDRWGRRQVLLVGMVAQCLFVAAYLFISDPALFVAVRFLEGAATASILPSARAAIADLVPDRERGRAYGTFSAFFNFGFLFGPAAGGLLAAVNFRLVFGLAVGLRVIGAVVIFAGLTGLPQSGPHARAAGTERIWKALLSMPLVAGYIIAFGDYLWLGFDQTLAPLWMRHHLAASIWQIGLVYSLWAVPGVLLAPLGGRLADRYPRWLLILVAGLGQFPMYLGYVLAHSIYVIFALFPIQACLYAVVSPAVDAHVAGSAPEHIRARAQSTFTAVG